MHAHKHILIRTQPGVQCMCACRHARYEIDTASPALTEYAVGMVRARRILDNNKQRKNKKVRHSMHNTHSQHLHNTHSQHLHNTHSQHLHNTHSQHLHNTHSQHLHNTHSQHLHNEEEVVVVVEEEREETRINKI